MALQLDLKYDGELSTAGQLLQSNGVGWMTSGNDTIVFADTTGTQWRHEDHLGRPQHNGGGALTVSDFLL
jgi:hypothetical protein